MPSDPPNRKLFLIWGSKGRESAETDSEKRRASTWMQLDLFPDDRPDALIFTTVTRRDLGRLSDLVRHCHARSILDLRELPSLAFENRPRDFFFDMIRERGVTYEHLDRLLGSKKREEAISQALQKLASGILGASETEWPDRMRRLVENGPTIVLTDTPPQTDEAAASLTESLSRSKIRFATVFAAEDRT